MLSNLILVNQFSCHAQSATENIGSKSYCVTPRENDSFNLKVNGIDIFLYGYNEMNLNGKLLASKSFKIEDSLNQFILKDLQFEKQKVVSIVYYSKTARDCYIFDEENIDGVLLYYVHKNRLYSKVYKKSANGSFIQIKVLNRPLGIIVTNNFYVLPEYILYRSIKNPLYFTLHLINTKLYSEYKNGGFKQCLIFNEKVMKYGKQTGF